MLRSKTASVRFIFITIFLDALGIGLLIPILPDLIRRFSADPAAVAKYFGYFISSYALMQFLASPVLGSLSDKFGRRPVLLISLLGAGLDYLVMAFSPTLLVLFIGRIISGLTGASFTVASAYMADISNDENRSVNFGMIGAAFGLGFIVGPALGGLLGASHHTLPFLAAALLNLLNFAFGWLILPESLPESSRREIVWRRLNPFSSLGRILKPSNILLLIWIYIFLGLAGHVHPSNWTLYTELKFRWTPFEVGLSLSFVGLLMAAAQGGLTRVVIPKLGEYRSLFWGLVLYILTFFAFAFAPAGWMMYVIMVLSSVAGVAPPALQSLITKHTPSNEQGELQGTLVSLMSLSAIISPVIYAELFAHFTRADADPYFPGAAYVCAGLFSVIAGILLLARGRQSTDDAPVPTVIRGPGH
ncbi:MAG: TCR/Tet family MFS transporter [Bdellovibrionaceae bacterium]|nr:TCR/Tet family MFS transporter [Pseudobdellovibrionaceae bacterium]MBX3034023.1 TCR/Tet family MFS transporter [Pseudobdellovibrionaceae bacterium]